MPPFKGENGLGPAQRPRNRESCRLRKREGVSMSSQQAVPNEEALALRPIATQEQMDRRNEAGLASNAHQLGDFLHTGSLALGPDSIFKSAPRRRGLRASTSARPALTG